MRYRAKQIVTFMTFALRALRRKPAERSRIAVVSAATAASVCALFMVKPLPL